MAAEDMRLAHLYGVAPSIIESFRLTRCTEGLHWTRHIGREGRVEWLPAGKDFIASLLGVEKKGGGAALPAPSRGTVLALPIIRIFPNPIWLQIRTPDGGTASVQVRRNERLTLRMKIECRLHPDGRWECTHKGLAVPLKPLAAQATTATSSAAMSHHANP